MSVFLKNLPGNLATGVYLCLCSPLNPIPSPPLHTVWIHAPVLNHTGKGGGGRWTSEKVRGPLVNKRDWKYQHDCLYLNSINSINSIKHQQRRHLGFGVFKVLWPMHVLYLGDQTRRNSPLPLRSTFAKNSTPVILLFLPYTILTENNLS